MPGGVEALEGPEVDPRVFFLHAEIDGGGNQPPSPSRSAQGIGEDPPLETESPDITGEDA